MLLTRKRFCLRSAHTLKRTLSVNTAKTTAEFEEEVAKFNKLSGTWWRDDKDALLMMNKIRVPLVNDLRRRFCEEEEERNSPLSVLDVGCGGGYFSEELAKHKYKVTAIDPSSNMIKIATNHANKYKGDLQLEYSCSKVEDITPQFDIVVASEVVEHVPCVETFVAQCTDRVKPGGGILFTTINRTLQSWLFAIMLAEHVARLVPPGTHEYHKFVPPSTLSGILSDRGFQIITTTGMSYNPLTTTWSTTSDVSVNYAITAIKT